MVKTLKVLITGASGFLGLNLVASAFSMKWCDVTAVSRSKPVVRFGNVNYIQYPFYMLQEEFLSSFDAVIHCASVGVNPSDRMNSLCIDINYLQALEFFKRLASSGVKIIYSLGSMSEYGAGSSSYELFSPKQILHPQTEYARSKSMLCESIALDKAFYGKNLTIRHIRLFYFYGSYESSIRLYPQILSCGITNTDLKLSHGRQVRDISNASEVAIKLFSLLYRDHNFPESNLLTISNLGSGRFLSIREFVLDVYKAHGFSNELLFGFNNLRSDEPMYAIPDLDPSNHLLVALQ